MSQYQSFPDAEGASRTFDKLLCLKLPSLKGRTFLDVGCNEGFFCGYAKFDGAARALGIDKSALFVGRARERFPDADFLQQGWEQLPEGPFDVILLASALHYADDQPALIRRLVDLLSSDGVLILELGIVPSEKAEWIKVKRGIDERYFPSMMMLREVLADYAWKWMGPSIAQDGDPVARHVLHITRRRPVAYLLMAPPGHGKSSLAKRLFGGGNVRLLSGDHQIGEVAKGKLDAPDALRDLISSTYSPFTLDETIRKLFASGLADQLVALWLRAAGPGDFALDMYVPAEHQGEVVEALRAAGYLAVCLNWEPIGPRPQDAPVAQKQAEAFYLAQSVPVARPGKEANEDLRSVVGFVDEARIQAGRLVVRGWAANPEGLTPGRLLVRLGHREVLVKGFEKQLRPDVQRALGTPHALLGFRISIVLEGGEEALVPSAANLSILVEGATRPLGMSQSLGQEGGKEPE